MNDPETQYRVQATLSNLTLKSAFALDRYEYEPLEDGQALLNRASSLDYRPIPSALVTTSLSKEEGEADRLPHQVVFDVDAMTLLASLFSRSCVRVVSIRKELLGENGWELVYEPWTIPIEGTVKPRPIRLNGDVGEFLERTLPVMQRDGGAALLQSLRFHVASYDRDFSESLYLKSFVSLEIIFGRIGENTAIATGSKAKSITKRARLLLESLREEGVISEEEKIWIDLKVPELLRKTAWNQVQDIYRHALSKHDGLHLSRNQFALFTRVRNSLAHTGEAEMPGEDHQQSFYSLRISLRQYVECLILVLIGQDPNIDQWYERKARLSFYFDEFGLQ